MEILLTQAIFGMGNANHDHVHRHNTLEISSQDIDKLKIEQFRGGVSTSTINSVASTSGGLSSRPQGYVNIEDGWNIRRGIGMLKFVLTENSMVSTDLSVLGYLVGGAATEEGISQDTMFVPVRSWETSTRNVQDQWGLPTPSTAITNSSQFLLADPTGSSHLRSLRPLDIANECLGYLACEQEGVENQFMGTITSDLSNGVQISKTNNLDSAHHARELIKLSTMAIGQEMTGGLENALADGMNSPGLGESTVTDNAFFRTMMVTMGTYASSGFQGWSIGEINSVFETLPDVMNLHLLNESNFAVVDNLMSSNEYGGSNLFEITASELALLTVHILITCGLTHLTFSATNNPHDFGGLEGSDDGVVFVFGECGSVLDNDNDAILRVQRFEQLMKNSFFRKYSTGYAHTSTIVNVSVSCSIFGETSVELFFNGDRTDTRRYINATYAINRTSSNISGTEVGLQASKNYVDNIKEYFN